MLLIHRSRRLIKFPSALVSMPTLVLLAFTTMTLNAQEKLPDSSRFVKVSMEGKVLEDDISAHRCVLDNKTGLLWEVKTNDKSLHSKTKTFRWGGTGAEKVGERFFEDWNSLVELSNQEKMCNASNWRVPTITELKSLVQHGTKPTIDMRYFPHTQAEIYWSSSAFNHYTEHAQTVHFSSGVSAYYNGFRGNGAYIRLVSKPSL